MLTVGRFAYPKKDLLQTGRENTELIHINLGYLILIEQALIGISAFPDKTQNPASQIRQALSLTYGCFFAEFLNELSLVHLGLLDLSTCVGLRYVHIEHILRGFSRSLAQSNWRKRSPFLNSWDRN